MFTVLFLLLAAFQQSNASGLLDIRLKSAHVQKATIVLANDVDPMYLVLPIVLPKNEEIKFEDLLVNFNETYQVTITLDETESLGLSKSIYRGTIQPTRGSFSPTKLNLPLNGMLLNFKCDENWSGEKCDEQCSDSKGEKPSHNDIDFEVDYIVNPHKLETIVKMLKKENEISNAFVEEKLDEEMLLQNIMESSGEQP